jgi:iron complex outermembrane receptor protein
VDLWNRRATINASYFDLLQDNTLVNDPAHPGFSIPGPGQRGRGVDLNIVGQLMQNWTVQASYTRTKYAFLSPSDFQTVIPNQPRDKYSIYSNYRTQITPAISGGFGAGLFGRSSSYAEYFGEFVVPEARQVDVNGFLTIAGFEFNVGVRNVFNRRNYGTTRASDFVPVDEPRNVRLTVTKQVF